MRFKLVIGVFFYASLAFPQVAPPLQNSQGNCQLELTGTEAVIHHLSTPVGSANSERYDQALKILESQDFYNQLYDWYARPGSAPTQIGGDVSLILSLSPEERVKAFSQISQTHGLYDEAILSAGLLLYDKTSWLTFLNRTLEQGDQNGELLGHQTQVIEQAPETLKDQILQWIGQNYSRASKIDHFPDVMYSIRLPPKRALDALLRNIINPQKLIASEISKGQSPQEAYATFLNRVDAVFSNANNSHYTADQVVKTLTVIQKWLARFPQDHTLTVFGSYPNGRARTGTSDLDVIFSHEEMEPGLSDLLQSLNGNNPQGGNFTFAEVSGHNIAEFDFNAAAEVNSIIFVVSAEKIEMWVYPIFFNGNRWTPADTNVAPERFRIL